ncbi:citramalate synthase [Salsipaludibacter albus]|uniref:citramalate synthase n=1 Tax=Salsipaludibacter albus TaxID=2849650 RepID=UPI001EE467F8
MSHTPLPSRDEAARALAPGAAPPVLYDTTLRDGTQREGINLTVEDKVRVARRMDGLGVHYLEGGWPGSNPKDTAFFRRFAEGDESPLQATLTAFGMTRMAGNDVAEDPLLAGLLEARTEVVCLVGKSWGYHVDDALGVPRSENLAMVTESVAHLVANGRRVFFDAEHFFDGFARDRDYALEVVVAAAEAGAEAVVLCDTNGGAMPWDVVDVVTEVRRRVGETDVGLHFHDDGGCAVANSMLGLQAGAVQVQGTANGLGERCGNANLFTVMADLQLKQLVPVVPPDALERLTEVSHAVADICNQATPSVQPYVGHTAFSHKAGLHASALAKAPDMYNHIDPGQVGNAQRLVVSEQSGRSNIVLKAREFGLEVGPDEAATVLAEVKRREAQGWTYDAADASFELLLRRLTGRLERSDEPFHTQHFRVSVGGGWEGRGAPDMRVAMADAGRGDHADLPVDHDESPAEAILAVEVAGRRRLGAGEGNGPVDALANAFRNAVNGTWPELEQVRLSDYKVRILEATRGTDAVTRVLVTSTDGVGSWVTVGVDPNIVEASWRALSDAWTYAILQAGWR